MSGLREKINKFAYESKCFELSEDYDIASTVGDISVLGKVYEVVIFVQWVFVNAEDKELFKKIFGFEYQDYFEVYTIGVCMPSFKTFLEHYPTSDIVLDEKYNIMSTDLKYIRELAENLTKEGI